MIVYGHLGDGSLHFNINAPAQLQNERDRSAFFAKAPTLNHAMHELVATYRGSLSAEHGIGQLKRDELMRYKNPVALEVMKGIKRALDPHGIMNPGKVLSP
jgi:FAD/FMN-containing dehydrogenase